MEIVIKIIATCTLYGLGIVCICGLVMCIVEWLESKIDDFVFLKTRASIIEFDKSHVFSALNAEELKIGSKCFFANTTRALKKIVQTSDAIYADTFIGLHNGIRGVRFVAYYNYKYRYCVKYRYAYLISSPPDRMYEPFQSVEKAMAAIKAHGRWVKDKRNNILSIVFLKSDEQINILNSWYSLNDILRYYVFADDDSPCGELVEE